MIVLVCALMSAANPGLTVTSPLDEVTQLDALLPDLLHVGPKLTAVLASEADLKKNLIANNVNAADIPTILASAAASRTPGAETPASFAATIAVLEPSSAGNSHSVMFYDGPNGRRLDLDVMVRADNSLVLAEPPRVAAENPWIFDLDRVHGDGTLRNKKLVYFAKNVKTGVWTEAPFPAANAKHCVDRMHAAAKQLVEIEKKSKKASGAYTKDVPTIWTEKTAHGVVTMVTNADEKRWGSTVSLWGGLETVTESGKIVEVHPCNLSAVAPKVLSPLDEVKMLDALFPALVKGGPKVTAMFATEKELVAEILAMDVAVVDAPHIAKNALEERRPTKDAPAAFTAVEAILQPGQGATHGVAFFDAMGHAAIVTALRRPDGKLALWGLANVREGTVEKATKSSSFDPERATHVVKKDGTWELGAPLTRPAEPKATCAELLTKEAKSFHVAEESYRAEFDVYAADMKVVGFEPHAGFKVAVKKVVPGAAAPAFLAEVSGLGGTVTVDDKRTITVVKACKEAP